jgi:tRNA(Ile)-lysidine synthase
MVLLDLLERYARERRLPRVGAAYLDHGWREREARLDGDLVEEFCAWRGLPFFRGHEHVPALARERGLSLEAAARYARYVFLAEVAGREGFAAVATAHHARDQAETLLLRFARGERGEGLAAIRPAARIAGVEVVRPLLAAEPRELVAYAERRRLPFREDASNADPRFPRNRLRVHAADRVPRADVRDLTRLAALERRLVEGAAERAEKVLLGAAGAPPGEPDSARTAPGSRGEARRLRLRTADLRALGAGLRRELLRRTIRRVSGRPGLPGRALGLLERLLASPTGGRADLRDARAVVSCGWLLLEAAPGRGPGRPAADRLREAKPAALPREGGARRLMAAFDPAEIRGTLVLRTWRPGDRIDVCRGGRGSGPLGRKKLKEIFREARVPAWQRAGWPLLADDRGVLWVVGLRRSDRARPRPKAPAVKVRVNASSVPAAAEIELA